MKNVALVILALGMLACNNGRGPSLVDSGTIVLPDTGTVARDTGTTPGPDTGSACAPVSATAPTAAACLHTTLTCLMGAHTATDQQACIDADPMAMNCNTCITDDLFASCTTSPGTCADEYGNVQCCLRTACPTGDSTCVTTAVGTGGMCATQVTAFNNCLDADQTAMRCGISNTCFMP